MRKYIITRDFKNGMTFGVDECREDEHGNLRFKQVMPFSKRIEDARKFIADREKEFENADN